MHTARNSNIQLLCVRQRLKDTILVMFNDALSHNFNQTDAKHSIL